MPFLEHNNFTMNRIGISHETIQLTQETCAPLDQRILLSESSCVISVKPNCFRRPYRIK
jgi:hypothetical protein